MRFVELLAKSASCKSDFVGRPEDVDESYLCGCPGKVVDAGLLHEILKNPADEHVFFGMGKCETLFYTALPYLYMSVVNSYKLYNIIKHR